MARAFLGLGSNIGDRLATLQSAADRLSLAGEVSVVRSSRVYETEPVGGPKQDDYLNVVVEIQTTRSPRELLDVCRGVEADLGRERTIRWGPRTIDVDVLTYDDRRVAEPDLEIPHPRMHERGFVLAPLLELEADPVLPGGARIDSLRLGSGALEGVRVFAPPLVVDARDPGS